MGRMHEIISDPGLDLLAYWQKAIDCVESEKMVFEDVGELDALFLRSPPPLHYEVMQLLSSVEEQVFMVNSLRGQLLGSSKLYTLNFQGVIPKSHVSRDPVRLRSVIDEFGGTMVMKPLRSFGGRGVIKVSSEDPENLNSLIDFYIRSDEPYPRREPSISKRFIPMAMSAL